MGPNVKKLVVGKFLSLCACDGDGVDAAIGVITIPGTAEVGSSTNHHKMKSLMQQSQCFIEKAIAAVKASPNNTYGDDEGIAGEILKRIESRNVVALSEPASV